MKRAEAVVLAVSLVGPSALPSLASAQGVVPLGPSFQMTDPDLPSRTRAPYDLIRRKDGDLLLLFGGSSEEILAQHVDALGQPADPSFQVNTYATGQQRNARAAVVEDGSVLIVWESEGSTGSDVYGSIQMRWLDPVGEPVGQDLQLNERIVGSQSDPTLDRDPEGAIMVAWDGYGIHARRVGSDGARLGAELLLDGVGDGSRFWPELRFGSTGGFVATWLHLDVEDDFRRQVRARGFGPRGVPLAPEVTVSADPLDRAMQAPQLAAREGGFVVAWESEFRENPDGGGDGSQTAVRARLLDDRGTPTGNEFFVNSYTQGEQAWPDVASDGTGGFIATWSSEGLAMDGLQGVLVGQRFHGDAKRHGGSFLLSDRPVEHRGRSRLMNDSRGVVFPAWHCSGPGGPICGRRFALDDERVFTDGFETGAPYLWSIVSP